MSGLISLRIDRDPDFFRLARMRGKSRTFVAESHQRIVGCISVTHQEVFINRTPEKVLYVGDLKVHPDYRSRGIAQKLMHALYDYAKIQEEDLVFCVVAEGNDKLVPLLGGIGRVPAFTSVGRFMVYTILPTPRQRSGGYTLTHGEEANVAALHHLINAHNRSYQFAPVLAEADFYEGDGADISPSDLLLAREENAIRAVVCPFDPEPVKSDVVLAMPMALHGAVRVMDWVGRLLPVFTPPRVGEALRMLYLRHLACAGGYVPALRMLLQHVRRRAFEDGYTFVTVGLHERDPVRSAVRGLPKFTFVSRGFVTSLRGRSDTVARIAAGITREDFALV